MSSKVTGLPSEVSGLAAPRATGWRLKSTLRGARKMCRCLELSTMIKKTSMTPMCSSSPTASSTSRVDSLRPSRRLPIPIETKAPLS